MIIHQIKRSRSAFQQSVNEQELRLQLGRELSGETITEVRELNSGLFNNTYCVTTSHKAYILKVAPKAGARVFYNERYLMQREQSISSQLQSVSPLVPDYLSFFTIDGRDAFLQSFIQGELWHDVISSLSEQENSILWHQLGAFAGKLHDLSGDQFGYPAPLQGFDQWSQFITDNVEGMAEDYRQLSLQCEEIDQYCNYLKHFQGSLDQVKTPKLLHGDLWPRNVIIGGAGSDIHIKAVIDGERAFWGDPISDWVLLLYGVPDAFWQGYGENLITNSDPVRITIYQGMYFTLNILEATRFEESGEEPLKRLAAVNRGLEKYT